MNDTLDISAILNATANQILAVVAPDTARLVRAYVSLDEQADTAATDGVHIWLPPDLRGSGRGARHAGRRGSAGA